MEKLGIIIQARLGSTRLPNKMTLPFYDKKGILEILLLRMKKALSENDTPIILATTTNPLDAELEELGNKLEIPVVRGSETNVLDRFIQAANRFNIASIIRICADNPFLDMTKLQELIAVNKNEGVDYYAYATSQFKPTILTGYGFWGEFVTLAALQRIDEFTNDPLYREHVTNYIYTHPDEFKIQYAVIDKTIEDREDIRLTVDTQTDFTMTKLIYADLLKNNIPIKAEAIVDFIATKPEWLEIMRNEMMVNKK